MLHQRTLSNMVAVTGIGIHSGRKATLTIYPAPADSGIQFKRVDLKDTPPIRASYETVSATENATTIGSGENVVHTVEHLLAVFYGLGINNAYCEINGPEIPIMDGSGASFVFLFKETGITNLNRSKDFLVVTKPVRVEFEDKWAQIEPAPSLTIESTVIFSHPMIKVQNRVFEFSCENFVKEVSRARTFGFVRDVDQLKKRGLAKGGSLDNAIILSDFGVMNPDGLRFADEFIRHKILDTIGDLSLIGYEIAGKVSTYKSGHKIHNMLCKKLFESPDSFQIVSSSSLQKEALRAFELPVTLSFSYN